MIGPPAAWPTGTAPDVPGSQMAPDVWLRDATGDGARRIPRATAERLIAAGAAERVSVAGHVRLRVGIRLSPATLPNGDRIHGLPAVELSRHHRGDRSTARAMRHMDRRGGT
jgi:hypothetical protein